MQAGADAVKVSLQVRLAVRSTFKALKGPFPQIDMIPTGGVNLETTADFLKAGASAVAVGGELVDAQTIKEGRYEVLEDRARQYLEIVRKTRSEMGAKAAAR